MIVVTGEFQIDPEDIAKMHEVAVTMMQETAKEDGCVCYRFYQDIEHADRIRVYEEWTDRAALEAHFTAPHMAAFREALTKIRVQSRELKTIENGVHTPL